MFIYITLFSAVGFEVAGTMLLPLTHNFSKPFPSALLLLAYGLSFYLLSLVTGKLPLLCDAKACIVTLRVKQSQPPLKPLNDHIQTPRVPHLA